MVFTEILLWLVVGLVVGGLAGFFIRKSIVARRANVAQMEADKLLADARDECKRSLLKAKEEAVQIRLEAESDYRDRRVELQRWDKRLSQREDSVEQRTSTIKKREEELERKEKDTEEIKGRLQEVERQQIHQLEVIGGMTSTEAKELLVQKLETQVREENAQRLRELEARLGAEADKRGREILATAIQRCATDVVSEATVSTVPIPSDEMKGRIIGREGRNIRALEHATGVELIIDDTPEAVTLSCFDPVRREIARLALSKLILDGRIHPARIEEVVQKAKGEVEAAIQSEGERAAYEASVQGLHPELIKLLGRLKYRFSYGQNVLMHSIEAAHIATAIATELNADVGIAKRAALLHDIGKAIDSEVEGTHASIGADVVQRWERSSAVTKAVAEHHEEVAFSSVESFIVATADAVSGARPGARRESIDQYLKRLEALESVANSFSGVGKSYAIQAGREIRILVKPEQINDIEATKLARNIASKVEEELQYPGQIKVTVIRETRVVDYAK